MATKRVRKPSQKKIKEAFQELRTKNILNLPAFKYSENCCNVLNWLVQEHVKE